MKHPQRTQALHRIKRMKKQKEITLKTFVNTWAIYPTVWWILLLTAVIF